MRRSERRHLGSNPSLAAKMSSCKTIIMSIIDFINKNQLLFGILFGWLFARITNYFGRPTIIYKISNDREFATNNKTFKFLNLIVKNKQINVFRKFLLGSSSLNNARVWLSFLDYASKAEMLKINGRWASTKEPVDYQSGQPIIPEVLLPSRDTIPPGEEASISVAIKEKGENSFFPFNNESYLHNWKNPDYELEEKKYFLRIRILADGNEYQKTFLLINPSKSLKNFKIL